MADLVSPGLGFGLGFGLGPALSAWGMVFDIFKEQGALLFCYST